MFGKQLKKNCSEAEKPDGEGVGLYVCSDRSINSLTCGETQENWGCFFSSDDQGHTDLPKVMTPIQEQPSFKVNGNDMKLHELRDEFHLEDDNAWGEFLEKFGNWAIGTTDVIYVKPTFVDELELKPVFTKSNHIQIKFKSEYNSFVLFAGCSQDKQRLPRAERWELTDGKKKLTLGKNGEILSKEVYNTFLQNKRRQHVLFAKPPNGECSVSVPLSKEQLKRTGDIGIVAGSDSDHHQPIVLAPEFIKAYSKQTGTSDTAYLFIVAADLGWFKSVQNTDGNNDWIRDLLGIPKEDDSSRKLNDLEKFQTFWKSENTQLSSVFFKHGITSIMLFAVYVEDESSTKFQWLGELSGIGPESKQSDFAKLSEALGTISRVRSISSQDITGEDGFVGLQQAFFEFPPDKLRDRDLDPLATFLVFSEPQKTWQVNNSGSAHGLGNVLRIRGYRVEPAEFGRLLGDALSNGKEG